MTTLRAAATAAVLATAGLAIAGCSQVSALAPVSGGPITTLRTAANDVLLENKVAILVAPECVEQDGGFTCTGSTVDAEPITVIGQPGDPLMMTVSVGGTVLYEGAAGSVIDRFAEVPQ